MLVNTSYANAAGGGGGVIFTPIKFGSNGSYFTKDALVASGYPQHETYSEALNKTDAVMVGVCTVTSSDNSYPREMIAMAFPIMWPNNIRWNYENSVKFGSSYNGISFSFQDLNGLTTSFTIPQGKISWYWCKLSDLYKGLITAQ